MNLEKPFFFSCLFALTLGLGVVQAADPNAAQRLFLEELDQLIYLRQIGGSQKQDISSAPLFLKDPRFGAALKKLLGNRLIDEKTGKPKSLTLEQLRQLASELNQTDHESYYLLAGLVRFERLREQNAKKSSAQIALDMLSKTLGLFPPDASALNLPFLPPNIKEAVLKALQEEDEKAGKPKRQELSAAGLLEHLQQPDPPLMRRLSVPDAVNLASALQYKAALDLGDGFLTQRADQKRAEYGALNPTLIFPKRLAEPPRLTPMSPPKLGVTNPLGNGRGAPPRRFFQPDGMIANTPLPGASQAAHGVVRIRPGGNGGGILAQPPEFSGEEMQAQEQAVNQNGRKSLAMEVGEVWVDRTSGRKKFHGLSLCQITFIDPEEDAPACQQGGTRRFIGATAKHCFENLQSTDVIRIPGFRQPIDSAHREVLTSTSDDDFAAILIDAPCDTKVPMEKLAPPDVIAGAAGRAMVMDLQQTGPKAVAGRTLGSGDPGFVGFNIIGNGEVFPGDSGGRASLVAQDGQTYYLGATSSKFTAPSKRNGMGFIAVAPPWFQQGIHDGTLLRRTLPIDAVVRHTPDQYLLDADAHG